MLDSNEGWTLHRKASITRNVLLETHLYPSVGVLVTLGRALPMVLWDAPMVLTPLSQTSFKLSHNCLSPTRAVGCACAWPPAPQTDPDTRLPLWPALSPALSLWTSLVIAGQYFTLGAWADLPCYHAQTPQCCSLAIQALPSAGLCSPPLCSHTSLVAPIWGTQPPWAMGQGVSNSKKAQAKEHC